MVRGATKRAVIYARLSVQGDETSTSISRQEDDLRALAAREGWGVIRVLVDDGISGREARANATEAVAMLADGRADVLAVWKFDRFTRQGLGALAGLMDALESRPGTLFVALQDGLRSDSAAWRLVAGMLAEVARMESDNISLRIKSDRAVRLRAGLWGGGRVPYGYRPVEALGGKRLVQDAEEVAVVREIVERLLGGESPYNVAGDLTDRCVPAPNSAARKALIAGKDPSDLEIGAWGHSVIVRMVTGAPLLGRQLERGETVCGADGEPILVSDPVLTIEESRRLHAMFPWRDNVGTRKHLRKGGRLLSGVVRCHICGARFHIRTHKLRDAVDYHHPMPAREGGKCPGQTGVRAVDLEEAVIERFLSEVGSRPHVVEQVVESTEVEAALIDLEAALAAASAALLAADGLDAESAALARISALKAERTRIRSTPTVPRREFAPTGKTVAEEFDSAATMEDRQRLLTAWLAAIEPRPVGSGRGPRGSIATGRIFLVVKTGLDDDGNVLTESVPLAPQDVAENSVRD